MRVGALEIDDCRVLLTPALRRRRKRTPVAVQLRQQRVIMRRDRKHAILKRELDRLCQPLTREQVFLKPFSGRQKRMKQRGPVVSSAYTERFQRPARQQAAKLHEHFFAALSVS